MRCELLAADVVAFDPLADLSDQEGLSALLARQAEQGVKLPVEPGDESAGVGLVVPVIPGAGLPHPGVGQGLGPQVRQVHVPPEVRGARAPAPPPDLPSPDGVPAGPGVVTPEPALQLLLGHGGVVAESPRGEQKVMNVLDDLSSRAGLGLLWR